MKPLRVWGVYFITESGAPELVPASSRFSISILSEWMNYARKRKRGERRSGIIIQSMRRSRPKILWQEGAWCIHGT